MDRSGAKSNNISINNSNFANSRSHNSSSNSRGGQQLPQKNNRFKKKNKSNHLSTHLLAPETVLPTPGPSAATTLWPALPSARQRWRHLVRPPPVTKTVRRSPGGSKKDCSPLRHRESKVARRHAKKQKGAATYRYSTE